MNGNVMSKFVSTPCSSSSGTTPCAINSFRERSKNRSPIQSPPLPKRILHFLETGKLGAKISSSDGGAVARHAGNHETAGRNKENRPILKTGSLHRRSRSTTDHNRKVSFRAKVVVFHFDREQGGHVHCESQTLNNEPDAKNGSVAAQYLHRQNSSSSSNNSAQTMFVTATQQNHGGGSILTNRNDALSHSTAAEDIVGSSRGHSNGTPTTRRRPLPPLQRNRQEPSFVAAVVVKDLNFQYSVDESRNSVLRFSLPLGSGTSAGDVIVKANKNGDRIRVFSSGGGGGGETGSAASSQKCREICERFALPVRVDSYRINARIDACGVLFVEAPILPTESSNAGSHSARKAV